MSDAGLRAALEVLLNLARGHDYADARDLAAGEDAIEDVLYRLEAAEAKVARVGKAFNRLADEMDQADPSAWAVLGGVTLGGAIRYELIELGINPALTEETP